MSMFKELIWYAIQDNNLHPPSAQLQRTHRHILCLNLSFAFTWKWSQFLDIFCSIIFFIANKQRTANSPLHPHCAMKWRQLHPVTFQFFLIFFLRFSTVSETKHVLIVDKCPTEASAFITQSHLDASIYECRQILTEFRRVSERENNNITTKTRFIQQQQREAKKTTKRKDTKEEPTYNKLPLKW